MVGRRSRVHFESHTLCGAYLLDRAYDIAESVCHKAAEHYPSKSSLNNFGIYLAIVGDFEGAIRAFNQVQPLHREEYLDFLRTKDIGLIALQNEAVVRDYQSRNMDSENETIRLLAKIEELAP